MTDIVEYCVDRLPALLRLLADSDVELLDVHDGETRVRVHRVPGAVEAPSEDGEIETIALEEPVLQYVNSPLVGTFYRAAEPGAAPLADVDIPVEPTTIVGYVEVLGESIEVEASVAGTIVEVLATDGDAVDYGHPLFAVMPDG